MPDAVISLYGIAMSYGKKKVLDGVSFEVMSGEIFGLIGPNGSGKTTLTNIMVGHLVPKNGGVKVFGASSISSNEIRGNLNVVPQDYSFYPDFSVEENIEFFASIYGIGGGNLKQVKARLMDWLELKPFAQIRAKYLSGGYKRLLNIACSLVNDPQLIFMDEPTVGLDPKMRQLMWKKINDLREQGKTIVLTTHYLDEAEELCDRIAMLSKGKAIALGTPEELIAEFGGEKVLIIRLSEDVPKKVEVALAKALGGDEVRATGKHILISLAQQHSIEKISAIISWLVQEGHAIESSNVKEPELEDVFLHLAGEEINK